MSTRSILIAPFPSFEDVEGGWAHAAELDVVSSQPEEPPDTALVSSPPEEPPKNVLVPPYPVKSLEDVHVSA